LIVEYLSYIKYCMPLFVLIICILKYSTEVILESSVSRTLFMD